MSVVDPDGKIVKGPGFLPVKTRRPNERLQFAQGDLAQGPPSEQARLAQILQGQRRIPPSGILSKDSTPDHFPARPSRPPALRSEAFQKCRIVAAENIAKRRLALFNCQVHIFKSYTRLPTKSRQAPPRVRDTKAEGLGFSGRLAPITAAHGQDARARAGETPALRRRRLALAAEFCGQDLG